MFRILLLSVSVLSCVPALKAGPPSKAEPARTVPAAPRGDDILAEPPDDRIVVLPGAPAPQAVAPNPEQQSAVAPAPEPDDTAPAAPRRYAGIPEELARDSALFLERRLGQWRIEDARRALGAPVRRRTAFGSDRKPDGEIYAFSDPSRRYREFELDFSHKTRKLRSVFVYPWNMKWDECRRIWGDRVISTEASNGRKFHSYENRRLDVLVDGGGRVISLGLY